MDTDEEATAVLPADRRLLPPGATRQPHGGAVRRGYNGGVDDDRPNPLDYASRRPERRLNPETQTSLITAVVCVAWLAIAAIVFFAGWRYIFAVRAP